MSIGGESNVTRNVIVTFLSHSLIQNVRRL